jgi:hypothetical protein
MWLPSLETLQASSEKVPSLFVVQLWHELLCPSSPDTFRARVLDLRLLLEELDRVADFAQQEPKWLTHVHAICEEIADQTPLPSQLYAIHPVAEAALRSISRFNGPTSELSRLREQALVYLDLTSDYLDRLLAGAQEAAQDPKNKKMLDIALKGLATHVQAHHLAEESIEPIADEVCARPPSEAVTLLCGRLRREKQVYSCFIAVDAERAIASSLFADGKFQERGAPRFSANEKASSWYSACPKGIVIEQLIEAHSRQKAAEQALGKVLTLVHLYALYANGSSVSVIPTVLVQQEKDFHVIDVTPSRHFGLEPRRASEQLARWRYKDLNSRLEGRLSNVLESHALGVAANDARSAVIHLWTALETLCGGLGTEGIGPRVANAIAPIIAWRRMDKIVTYLAISINELMTHLGSDFDRTYMPKSTVKHVERSDVLACLAGPTNNPGILALFTQCSSSPLLNYRIYRMWEEFSDPKEAKKALERSKERVRWQTLRFYRVRNLLVHYGQLDRLALQLLENAQYYLSTCVGRVLHDLTVHRAWKTETSLEFYRHKYESLLSRLQIQPAGIAMCDVLVHTKEDTQALTLWGDKGRFARK